MLTTPARLNRVVLRRVKNVEAKVLGGSGALEEGYSRLESHHRESTMLLDIGDNESPYICYQSACMSHCISVSLYLLLCDYVSSFSTSVSVSTCASVFAFFYDFVSVSVFGICMYVCLCFCL